MVVEDLQKVGPAIEKAVKNYGLPAKKQVFPEVTLVFVDGLVDSYYF